MKKTIGLGILLLTGMTAFAAPAAYGRYENRNARTENVRVESAYNCDNGAWNQKARKEVVVRHDDRAPAYRNTRIGYNRGHR